MNIWTNSIIWGNWFQDIYVGLAAYPVVTYSDIQDGWAGLGHDNISTDPSFADSGNADYHLKSEEGCWDPNALTWVYDGVTSPCIDGGDPNSDWTDELWPHGKRINMGAYGGTPEASMSLSDVGNIANLDNDTADIVDFNDLYVFVSSWFEKGIPTAGDLNHDGEVNFVDYAILAQHWGEGIE